MHSLQKARQMWHNTQAVVRLLPPKRDVGASLRSGGMAMYSRPPALPVQTSVKIVGVHTNPAVHYVRWRFGGLISLSLRAMITAALLGWTMLWWRKRGLKKRGFALLEEQEAIKGSFNGLPYLNKPAQKIVARHLDHVDERRPLLVYGSQQTGTTSVLREALYRWKHRKDDDPYAESEDTRERSIIQWSVKPEEDECLQDLLCMAIAVTNPSVGQVGMLLCSKNTWLDPFLRRFYDTFWPFRRSSRDGAEGKGSNSTALSIILELLTNCKKRNILLWIPDAQHLGVMSSGERLQSERKGEITSSRSEFQSEVMRALLDRQNATHQQNFRVILEMSDVMAAVHVTDALDAASLKRVHVRREALEEVQLKQLQQFVWKTAESHGFVRKVVDEAVVAVAAEYGSALGEWQTVITGLLDASFADAEKMSSEELTAVFKRFTEKAATKTLHQCLSIATAKKPDEDSEGHARLHSNTELAEIKRVLSHLVNTGGQATTTREEVVQSAALQHLLRSKVCDYDLDAGVLEFSWPSMRKAVAEAMLEKHVIQPAESYTTVSNSTVCNSQQLR